MAGIFTGNFLVELRRAGLRDLVRHPVEHAHKHFQPSARASIFSSGASGLGSRRKNSGRKQTQAKSAPKNTITGGTKQDNSHQSAQADGRGRNAQSGNRNNRQTKNGTNGTGTRSSVSSRAGSRASSRSRATAQRSGLR